MKVVPQFAKIVCDNGAPKPYRFITSDRDHFDQKYYLYFEDDEIKKLMKKLENKIRRYWDDMFVGKEVRKTSYSFDLITETHKFYGCFVHYTDAEHAQIRYDRVAVVYG